MRKPIAGSWWSPTSEGLFALIVTAAFFAVGALAGFFLALRLQDGGASALGVYLDQFISSASSSSLQSPDLFPALWRSMRWPFFAVLLGFSSLGLLGVPILSLLRGFLLSFSIASFTRAYGRAGLTAALLLQGIPGLVAVPAFFVLCVQGFFYAWRMARRDLGSVKREPLYLSSYFFYSGLGVLAYGLSFLLERYLIPGLMIEWAVSTLA